MSNPTPGDVHVNTPLSNMSVAYMQDPEGFIADRVFPNLPVKKQSDRYYVYSRADFNRDEMEERAPGTESAGSGYDLDNTPTYYCPVQAFHKDVSDQMRGNQDDVLDGDRDATIFVSQKGLIRRERMFALNYFKAGVWAYGKKGVDIVQAADEVLKWDNANSTPIEDVRGGKQYVQSRTGVKINIIVLGKRVYDVLLDHPDIIDRIKYGQTPGKPAMVNKETLAALFEVDEVLVMEAVYNSAAKGVSFAASQALENSDFIGGDHCLLAYRTKTPGIMTPTAGYTFSWTGFMGASAMGGRIKKFRMEQLESDRIEIQMASAPKVVCNDLGYFFENMIHNPASG